MPYKGLAFIIYSVRTNSATGLQAHSGTNLGVTSFPYDQAQGRIPYITTDYTGSRALYFTPKSTYIGCVLLNPAGASIGAVESCTIEWTGTKYPCGATVTQTCTFSVPLVDTAVKSQMQPCTFDASFASVRRVVPRIVSATAGNLTGTFIDDFVYTLYSSG